MEGLWGRLIKRDSKDKKTSTSVQEQQLELTKATQGNDAPTVIDNSAIQGNKSQAIQTAKGLTVQASALDDQSCDLWSAAYDNLKVKNKDLVDTYEIILTNRNENSKEFIEKSQL